VDEGHDGWCERESAVSCVGPAWAQWVEKTSSGRGVGETIAYAVLVGSSIDF
jgi:hypothetical protein